MVSRRATATLGTVDFLAPIEVGELVTMKASVNYVGKSSMIIGIRVESENIQTGLAKHCNSSFFTMVAKDKNGQNVTVPQLILSSYVDIRRFYYAVHIIQSRKHKQDHEVDFDYKSASAIENLKNFNVVLDLAKN